MFPSNYSLGANLKEARQAAGLTGQQLAELMCRSKHVIHRWESDKCIPNALDLYELACLLDQSIEQLMGLSICKTMPNAKTLSEWATILGVSRQALSYQYRTGQLVGFRRGKVVYATLEEIEKYQNRKRKDQKDSEA